MKGGGRARRGRDEQETRFSEAESRSATNGSTGMIDTTVGKKWQKPQM